MEPGQQTTKKAKRSMVSAVCTNGTLVELVLDPILKRTGLAVMQGGKVQLVERFVDEDASAFEPLSAENNLVKHGAVLLPEAPAPYTSTESLVEAIQAYIHRYVDLSDGFLNIAAHYILLTWVYDAFNELPYLRLRGDFGCGKTRALLVLGSICYKPFFASGASTVSPIFHTIDTFRGTLVFDEADFRFSDEKAELIKIFNNGNVRGFPVFRTAMTAKREFDPVAFAVFGPKIVGMRDAFQDPALESRFLTEEMGHRAMRPDIPINLPESQAAEALALRNQLLMYRFQMLQTTKVDPAFVSVHLSHRLNQILVPLLSIIPSQSVRAQVTQAAGRLESLLRTERSATVEARLLEVLLDALRGRTSERVTLADITAQFIARFGAEFERPISNRYLGSILQRRLRIYTYKSHGTFVVPAGELAKVEQLCVRYGISTAAQDSNNATGGYGDMGTSKGASADESCPDPKTGEAPCVSSR